MKIKQNRTTPIYDEAYVKKATKQALIQDDHEQFKKLIQTLEKR